MKMKNLIGFTALAAALLFAGCDTATSDAGDAAPGTVDIAVTGVTVANASAALSIEVGSTSLLAYSVLPANANGSLAWSSSVEGVAAVSAAGLVTAVAEGSTVITLAAAADPSIKSTRTVNVVAAGSLTPNDSFVFYNQADVPEGTTSSMPYIVGGRINLVNTSLVGEVKNDMIQNSLILYKTAFTGNFKIQARVFYNSSVDISANHGITVGAYADTVSGSFSADSQMTGILYRNRGDVVAYAINNALGTPGNSVGTMLASGAPAKLEYIFEVTRSDTGYAYRLLVGKTGTEIYSATIDNNDLTNDKIPAVLENGQPVFVGFGVSGGDVQFSNIKIWNDLTAGAAPVFETSTVTAQPVAVSSVSITGPASYAAGFNDTLANVPAGGIQLTGAVAPLYADDTSIVWSSDSTTITVGAATGLVTVSGTGTATITATSGNGFTATYPVTVTAGVVLVGSITVNAKASLMASLSTKALATVAGVGGATPTNASITWSVTSGTGTATVDSTTGVVTGLTAGTVTVVATANDAGAVSGSAGVTVTSVADFTETFLKYSDQTDTVALTYTLGNAYAFDGGATLQVGNAIDSTTGAALTTNSGCKIGVVALATPYLVGGTGSYTRRLQIDKYRTETVHSGLIIPVTGNCTITVGAVGNSTSNPRTIDIQASDAGATFDATSRALSLATSPANDATDIKSFVYTGGAGSVMLSTKTGTGAINIYYVNIDYP